MKNIFFRLFRWLFIQIIDVGYVSQRIEETVGKGIDWAGEKAFSITFFRRLFAKLRYSRFGQAFERRFYRFYERKLLEDVKANPVPKHLGIIMDGNRRFARKLGLDPVSGHEAGKKKLEEVVEWCRDAGIKVLTVYAFSTENFDRDNREVDALMRMFAESFRKMADDERIHKNKVRIRAIGRLDMLPEYVRDAIEYAQEKTKDYSDYIFNIAIAYGGRIEIVDAIRNIAKDAKAGKLDLKDINENTVSKRLYTADLPDPDLILRTSGEERISNFLLWQIAYSELCFVDVYWPEFTKRDLLRAIRTYQKRERRIGK